jgi:hypothetical protein
VTWQWVTLILGLATLLAAVIISASLAEVFRTRANAELERAQRRSILERPCVDDDVPDQRLG